MKNKKKDIAIILPVYNNEGSISKLTQKIKVACKKIKKTYEILFVDDGSNDQSWSKICKENSIDKNIKGINFISNFGQHNAIIAGLELSSARYNIVMDCDLQDNPKHICDLYSEITKNKNDVVAAAFSERNENFFQRIFSNLFWKIISILSNKNFNNRIGNYMIFPEKIKNGILKFKEQDKLLGGVLLLMGCKFGTINFRREARYSGKSSYTFLKRLKLSINLIINYSNIILKYFIFFNFIILLLSSIAILYILYLALFDLIQVAGWAGVIGGILSILIIQSLFLIIISLYVNKLYSETKNRPNYLIRKIV
jgi:dolichol-phosphate mannosyltransferase